MEIMLYIIFGIIAFIIIGIFVIKLFEKPIDRTHNYVLRNMRKIINETDDDIEFDDFISVPIINKRYEEIRSYCCKLRVKGVYSNYEDDEKGKIKNFISELERTNITL